MIKILKKGLDGHKSLCNGKHVQETTVIKEIFVDNNRSITSGEGHDVKFIKV